jgi:hypothetical protein
MLPSEYPEIQAYANLKKMLQVVVDMQFADLRDLMRLPAYTLTTGMNLTAAARLFDMISGSSICFYNSKPAKLSQKGISGKEFKGLLTDFFPWNAVSVPEVDAIEVFYDWARNPLAHALGVDVRPGNPDVALRKGPLTKARVLRLENSATLPQWAAAPLVGQKGQYSLNVPGLFWGVHRMLHKLFADATQAKAADVTAASIPV